MLPPKLRTIMAMLLILHDQVVPTSQFIDEIWLGDPPVTVVATMQTYIYQLRKLLGIGESGHEQGIALLTEPSGYQLQVAPECIDVPVFERCFQAGQKAFAEGDYARAANSLESALSLWRSQALADVQKGPFLESYAAHLEETKIQVTELRIDAYLQLGRNLDAIRELKSLIINQPLHEGLHSKLMLALHRSGRRHEALAVFGRLRRSLVDELGIEPSPPVQRLHRALLAADPSLDLPAVRAAEDVLTAPTVVAVPAQIPADIPDFIGRDFVLGRLEQTFLQNGRKQAPPMVSITGMAGVGKSALAVRLAHRVRQRFPDGQFFAALRRNGAAVDPSDVLADHLHAIGFAHSQIPAALESRSQLFCSWCADRRVLIVLDDAMSEEQVRPLLPGSPQCAVIMTNRSPLYGISGLRTFEINPLAEDDAIELLGMIVGRRWSGPERKAARSIVDYCENLPLAVRAVGARLARPASPSLDRWVASLEYGRRRIEELCSGTFDMWTRLEQSYLELDDSARAVLLLLGRHAPARFGVDEIARWFQIDSFELERMLSTLVDARLLLVDADGAGETRYTLLSMIRAFALERFTAELGEHGEGVDAADGTVDDDWDEPTVPLAPPPRQLALMRPSPSH